MPILNEDDLKHNGNFTGRAESFYDQIPKEALLGVMSDELLDPLLNQLDKASEITIRHANDETSKDEALKQLQETIVEITRLIDAHNVDEPTKQISALTLAEAIKREFDSFVPYTRRGLIEEYNKINNLPQGTPYAHPAGETSEQTRG